MRAIWDFLVLDQPLRHMDAIIALGSNALRVVERAAELYRRGYGAYVICAGGSGRTSVFDRPEAHIFAELVEKSGVPPDRILVEDTSRHSGENIQFVRRMLEEQGLPLTSFVLVQKPYMERRAYATFAQVWPEGKCVVTSPRVSFEEYTKDEASTTRLAHLLVGNLQRIYEYSRNGFIVPQVVPPKVWDAYQLLVESGYTEYLASVRAD